MATRMITLPGRQAGTINGTDVKGLGAQCPYCSKAYDEYDYEKGQELQFPSTCRRCGSPMDDGPKALAFADAVARKEQHTYPTPVRPNRQSVDEALAVLREAGLLPAEGTVQLTVPDESPKSDDG